MTNTLRLPNKESKQLQKLYYLNLFLSKPESRPRSLSPCSLAFALYWVCHPAPLQGYPLRGLSRPRTPLLFLRLGVWVWDAWLSFNNFGGLFPLSAFDLLNGNRVCLFGQFPFRLHFTIPFLNEHLRSMAFDPTGWSMLEYLSQLDSQIVVIIPHPVSLLPSLHLLLTELRFEHPEMLQLFL